MLDKFIQILEENNLRPADIDKIISHAAPVAQFKIHRENPLRTQEDCTFNTLYLVACAAHRINPTFWQDSDTRQNPEIRAFMQRVEFSIVLQDKGLGTGEPVDPRVGQQGIEVFAKGKAFTGMVSCTGGSCQLPVFRNLDEQLVKKFRDNSSRVFSLDNVDKTAQQIFELEKLANVAQLMEIPVL